MSVQQQGDVQQHDQSTVAYHAQWADATLAALAVDAHGLSEQEAAARLARFGPNQLPEPKRHGALMRLLLQFHNVLIYVLLSSAVITALLGHQVDTFVIIAVVLVNALIGYVQEGKAERALQAIRHMLAPRAAVLRDGERRSVDGKQLVPGDIVLLEAGDRVPADVRLLAVHGLTVQESVLTGESVAVEKLTVPVAADAPLGDRSCLAFSGTLVTAGQGRGVVIATGAATEIGRISHLLEAVQTQMTPLLRQMQRFSQWLTLLILLVAGVLLAHGYFIGHHAFGELFMAVVGLSVAAIPEGLPAVLTITLAVGVQAVAKRQVIVRRLPAIEALGAVSVICTDKTGTLTRNEMMVVSALVPGGRFRIDGIGYAPHGEVHADPAEPPDTAGQSPAMYGDTYRHSAAQVSQQSSHLPSHLPSQQPSPPTASQQRLSLLARAAVLCSEATLRQHDDQWLVEGDPMEGALVALAGRVGLDARHERLQWQQVDAIPFDASYRYMATLNREGGQRDADNNDGQRIIFVKGAPERIIGMCRHQYVGDGNTPPIDAGYWEAQIEALAARGQRVLALAMRRAEPAQQRLTHDELASDLVLLGVVGMIDPPRPEAVAAIADCHRAGIQVKMITGDHASTAAAIGAQIGLGQGASGQSASVHSVPGASATGRASSVLTGADLDRMSDQALAEAVIGCDIFARTNPEHKLRLVMALQAQRMTVAMTGDGVNDAPALRRADAGVAMGGKGSEAAKEAAELVLIDDNFASIVAAIREGRTVYDNIKKVISWTLPTNAGEALTIIVALMLGLALPITPVQILWVNLITAATLGLALAFEPTEESTMRRPPRASSEPLLDGALVWHVVLVSGLFLCGVYGIHEYALERGYPVELARTLVMNTLVVMEIFHLFFIRNIYGTSLTLNAVKGTPVVWLTVGVVVVAQLAVTYLPPLQQVFETRPVSLADGLLVIGIGVALFVLVETEKQVRLRLLSRREVAHR